MSAAKPKPPKEATQTEVNPEATADRLVGRMEELETARERSRQAEQERLWSRYRAVLLSPTPPTEHDLDRLVDVCAELGITPDQTRRHIKIVTKAREKEDLHAHDDEYHRASVEAREARRQVERENEQRLKDANDRQFRADSLFRKAHGASDELTQLSRQCPELFDVSATPPRLLTAESDRPSRKPGRVDLPVDQVEPTLC